MDWLSPSLSDFSYSSLGATVVVVPKYWGVKVWKTKATYAACLCHPLTDASATGDSALPARWAPALHHVWVTALPPGKGSSTPGFSSEKEDFGSPISRVVKRTQLYIIAARHEKLGALFTAYFPSSAHRLLTFRFGFIYLSWGRFWLFTHKDKPWVGSYPGKEILMSGILFRQVFQSFQRYPWAPSIQRWQSK